MGCGSYRLETFPFTLVFGSPVSLDYWQGGFNFGPRPVYFGMDKNSQWVELLYRICAPTLFIRRRLGPVLLDLRFEPVQVWFSTPSVAPQPLAEAGLGKG